MRIPKQRGKALVGFGDRAQKLICATFKELTKYILDIGFNPKQHLHVAGRKEVIVHGRVLPHIQGET
jgi:hypothetical protein